MKKPKCCYDCPAVERNKNKIQCGCLRTNTAEIASEEQKKNMWARCPLKWDSP